MVTTASHPKEDRTTLVPLQPNQKMAEELADIEGLQPKQASAFRKGDIILIKGAACRIVDMSTSKTGKHGHAKINFTALDIFNNRKYQEMSTSTANCYEVVVVRNSYMVTDIEAAKDSEGQSSVHCMDDDNEESHFPIPEDKDVAATILKNWELVQSGEEDRDLYVTVIKALGREQIIGSEWKAPQK